jgi:catechol 2,3-dioxygenase-like lactoylglutathione lyase family enzyme
MDMKLEVIVVPVSDVDKAKEFYTGLGWRLDADFTADDGLRVVQITPTGSGCSIIVGNDVTLAAPGSLRGLHLVVEDLEAARGYLHSRGVQVSDAFHDIGGVFHHADRGQVAGPDSQRRSYASFATFNDPDGNEWFVQEITERLPGR